MPKKTSRNPLVAETKMKTAEEQATQFEIRHDPSEHRISVSGDLV